MNKRTVTLDDLHPQTKDELDIARSLLPAELEKRQLTGIPSVDRVWRSYYSGEQLSCTGSSDEHERLPLRAQQAPPASQRI